MSAMCKNNNYMLFKWQKQMSALQIGLIWFACGLTSQTTMFQLYVGTEPLLPGYKPGRGADWYGPVRWLESL